MALRFSGLTPPQIPVIIFGVDTLSQLVALFRAGWSVQVAPEPSPFGPVYATVVWSCARSEIERTIDGPIASLPMVQRVNLVSVGEGSFAGAVADLYARVYPVSPFGDIGLGDDLPPDIPAAEL